MEDNFCSATSDFWRLRALIYVFGINKQLWPFLDEERHSLSQHNPLKLRTLLVALGVAERKWHVLEERFGFDKRRSYDEIALNMGGLTRARAQQLVNIATHRIEIKMQDVLPFFYLLESQARSLWPFVEEEDINAIVYAYHALLTETGWEDTQLVDVRRLILTLRALVGTKQDWVQRCFPKITYAACRIPPVVLRHEKVAEEQAKKDELERRLNRRLTYEDLAESVLQEAQVPLHYKVIAERAELLRSDIQLKGIHNVLVNMRDKFALVAPGIYGLTAWGLASVEAYPDIIADILQAAQMALTYGNLLQRVQARRTVKQQTLQMLLDMHPRFYYSQAGTYGLRIWLLPREKQTLRTPQWLVETTDSHERVQRATEHGYDVANIVTQDE